MSIADKHGMIIPTRMVVPDRIVIFMSGISGRDIDLYDGDTGEKLLNVIRVRIDMDHHHGQAVLTFLRREGHTSDEINITYNHPFVLVRQGYGPAKLTDADLEMKAS